MRYIIISLLCAALSINLTAAENSAIVEQELQRLDSILAKADVFIARKKSHIENIGKSVASAMTNDDLITIYDHIYDDHQVCVGNEGLQARDLQPYHCREIRPYPQITHIQ